MKRHLCVHIVPLRHEHDRTVGPIEDDRPDKVYLPEYEDSAVECPTYHEAVVDRIADIVDSPPDVEYLDLFDMYEVIGVVTTIADWHPDDFVRVNVTASTKRAAVGTAMACMGEYTDVEPYVVNPEVRPHGLDTPVMEGFVQTLLLTTYQIDSSSPNQAAALAIIEAHGTDARHAEKKTLITEAARYGLEFMRGHVSGEADDYDPVTGDYNVLDNHVTATLEHQGYATIIQRGTRRYFELTEEGRQTFRAFRHRAESVVSDLEVRTDDLSESADFALDNLIDALAENR